jgi:hypothetical protein
MERIWNFIVSFFEYLTQKKRFRYQMKYPGELDTWQYTQVSNILKEGGPRAAEVMKIIKEERPNYKEPPGRWR